MYDVAIIGGGPAGSSCASLLKRYRPDLNVLILEREKFPREHIGESLLPAVCQVFEEMGVWDKIEAQNFPVKIGGTYRWGATPELWDFQFIPGGRFDDEPRPAKFKGQRFHTAFQVDRGIFDKVLLDHAESLGCEVREETKVVEVMREGDRVTGLKLEAGEIVEARYYLDATGVSGTLRRAMEIPVDYPTSLRNIAIWDYWQNADWAINIGVGGTRIFVASLDWGWIWFIPIGETRTSVGLVLPLDYYKKTDKKPDELYRMALEEAPLIKSLMTNAICENKQQTTNDWSYIAERLSGENWWLVGDTCGFADPILSAGITLAVAGARQVAYSIVAIESKEHDAKWLGDFYTDVHKKRIGQHVMFADFWYKSNGQFTDLLEYTSQIAKEAGLNLKPDDAFRWLGTGGFSHEDPALPILGGCAIEAVQQINQQLTGVAATWKVASHNVFKLNLEESEEAAMPLMFEGKIWQKVCYRRDGKILPKYGVYDIAIKLLQKESHVLPAVERLRAFFQRNPIYDTPEVGINITLSTIEAMIAEGWVDCEVDPDHGFYPFTTPSESSMIHKNFDLAVKM